jgi:hypothetical protein
MRFLTALALGLLLMSSAPELHAQAGKNKAARILEKQKRLKEAKQQQILERFLNMSPEQRRQALEQLPPARRRQILQRLQMLELLSDEERRLLRGRYQLFLDVPPARREALRSEIRELRQLPQQERRRRLASDETKQRFSADELQLLYEVAGMPDPPQQ